MSTFFQEYLWWSVLSGFSVLVLTSGGLAWISLSVDLVPSIPVKQHVPRSYWLFLWWSVLSRVRVIADPAWSSLHGRGLPVDADFGWTSRLSHRSAEHECTPSTDTHGFMVVVLASVFGAYAGFDSGYMQASVFRGAVWTTISHVKVDLGP